MSKITINEQEYETDSFSEEAKKEFQMIQFVDGELQRLQAKAAVLQTARIAYVNSLSRAVSTDKKPAGKTAK